MKAFLDMHRVLRAVALSFVLAALLPCAVRAAPIPNAQRVLKLDARDQPIAQFMQDVFALVDVPVIVSPNLQGLVNGSFNTTADKLLSHIARAYNLSLYFDGAVMSVEPANEIATRSFSLQPGVAEKVLRIAGELQMPNQRNSLRRTSTGTLVATGARRFVQQVEELVRQAARPDGDMGSLASWRQPLLDFRVFYLRYAWAQDVAVNFAGRQTVVPGVVNILRSITGLQTNSGAMTAPGARTRPKLRGQGMASARQGGSTLGMPDDSARGNADVIATALQGRPESFDGGSDNGNSDPLTQATGFTRIEADPRLNAVIVRDLPERLARFGELVAALDVEPQALEIEATIIDINTDKLRELGVNWRYNHGLSSLMFGNGTASDQRLNGKVDPTPVGEGGILSAVLGDRNVFVARISALQTTGAAKIVSSPQVVTLSNVEAVFDNSSTFYVRVAGREDVDLFNVTAGTTLRVTPHVFKDAGGATRIKLLTQVEDGSLTQQTVDTLPVVERSAVNTQALITEGESLLIGGMVRDSATENEEKVPLLGDVPFLGHLFKTTTRGNARIERLFLISPRLASSKAARDAAARAAQPLNELSPSYVVPRLDPGTPQPLVMPPPDAAPAPLRPTL